MQIQKIELTNGIIRIRPYRTSDIESCFKSVEESLSELLPWLPWCHSPYSIKETKKWIKLCHTTWDRGSEYAFAIIDAKNGAYLGGCGLSNINSIDQFANVDYWVRSSKAKQGIATAVVFLLARFGFEELKLNRLEIVVAVDNKASIRVAQKVGAKMEGILRNRLVVRDKIYDAMMFSLIPQDIVIN